MSEGIGARVLRKEDLRFLTGRGEFVADLAAPDALHCAIVRSPHAHARIRAIDASAAFGTGVAAVLTGTDMCSRRRRADALAMDHPVPRRRPDGGAAALAARAR